MVVIDRLQEETKLLTKEKKKKKPANGNPFMQASSQLEITNKHCRRNQEKKFQKFDIPN